MYVCASPVVQGYFEDRRPASNMDPYTVTAKVFETSCFE